MKHKLKIILSVLIFFGCSYANDLDNWFLFATTALSAGTLNPLLRMHLSVGKWTYIVAEPIFLTITMENYGDEVAYSDDSKLWYLHLMDENGRTFEYRAMRFEPALVVPEGTTFKRGSPVKAHTISGGSHRNLLDYYGEGQPCGNCYYLNPGQYTLYSDFFDSDTLRINIINSTDATVSAASQFLKNMADNCMLMRGFVDSSYKYNQMFLSKYPNSILAIQPLVQLMVDFDLKAVGYTKEEQQEHVQMLISRFPLSGYFYRALYSFDPAFVRSEDRQHIIEALELGKKALGPGDLSEMIDNYLSKLRK